MMNTRSGGGAAAASQGVSFFMRVAGRRSAWRSRLCRSVAAGSLSVWSGCRVGTFAGQRCKPARPARRDGLVEDGTMWTAELWLRKRATVYWRRLEQPEAGGFLPAAERTVKHKMPSCGAGCTLWSALDGQRVQAVEQPCRRPEDAAIEQRAGRSHPAPPAGDSRTRGSLHITPIDRRA